MLKSLGFFFKEIEIIFLNLFDHLEWFPRIFYYTARLLKLEEYRNTYLLILTIVIILIIVNIFSKKK